MNYIRNELFKRWSIETQLRTDYVERLLRSLGTRNVQGGVARHKSHQKKGRHD
jgi:hypothetical protein